jgi:hexosaminidase
MGWEQHQRKQLVRSLQDLAKGMRCTSSAAGLVLTLSKAYSFNPLANITKDQEKLVLGGQQLLWTEQAGPSNLESIAWPRAAASAEVFWSGPGGDVRTALPRLHDLAYRYIQRGVKAIALQPEWCALRPGKCDLDA